MTDYVASTAIAGAVVTIGGTPAPTCIGWAKCGTPQAPVYTATTSAAGTFSVNGIPSGTYFMTIVSARDVSLNPATGTQSYTILHRTVTVSSANLALGGVNISQLAPYESAWLAQINTDRQNSAVPATSAVVADEYDEEAARAEAAAVAAGTDPFGDTTETLFLEQALSQPGYLGPLGGGVAAAGPMGPFDWAPAETALFQDELQNCIASGSDPTGSWETCPFEGDTGHYINLAQDSVLWLGVGESANAIAADDPTYGGDYVYDAIITNDATSARTAAAHRVVSKMIPPQTRNAL